MNKTLRVILAFTFILALTFILGIAEVAHAELWDRGGGLIYDDVRNITWLQDANLANTETFGVEGILAGGRMYWPKADEWINAMNAANYLGYSDWRFPKTDYPYAHSYAVPGDLQHLYQHELGNTPSPGYPTPGPPVNMTFTDGNDDTVSFENFVTTLYWYSDPYLPTPGSWNSFQFYFGHQYAYVSAAPYSSNYWWSGMVWPVRDGDSTTNNPPSLDPIGPKSGSEGQLLEFAISATDPDPEDTLTFSAGNLPDGASFDPATAVFSWMPSFDDAGNYENVEFSVTDDGTPPEVDCESITITIGDINRPPVIDPVPPITVQEYELVEFTITALDPDGHDILLSSGDLPMGSFFNTSNGFFTWIPDYNQAGVHSIQFFATDIGIPAETSEANVVITVADIPPTDLVNEIIDSYTNDLNLPEEVVNSYTANLKKVERFIEKGKVRPAINQLNAFVNKVTDDIDQARISPENGQSLIDMATDIINKLD